ncbi:MAG TPA: heavy metal translocating P-type ATPase [Opitutales bacterium]|nr:heavy metal translocating P-type ATPase [Opitutales bacterium]
MPAPAADALDESWVSGLAEFLNTQENVEALVVEPGKRRIAVATLGPVDEVRLRARLAEILRVLHEHEHTHDHHGHAPTQERLPAGMKVSTQAGEMLLEKGRPCQTAARFRKWREIPWPEMGHTHTFETGEDWKLLATLAGTCLVFLLAGYIAPMLAPGVAWLGPALFIAAMGAGGWDALVDSLDGLRHFQVDIHFLMIAVAVGASAIGHFGEGALLLFLFSTSGALEEFAMHRTRRAIDALFKAAPKTARREMPGGGEETIPVEDVRPGDILLAREGDAFPVDGEMLSGKTAADESNLTGESTPVEKQPGDPVYSGTLNLWGAARFRATARAAESSLQKIIRLIQEAQHLKAPSQRFTDKFGTPYALGIMGAALALFLFDWLVLGTAPFHDAAGGGYSAFYRAMTLLVVASPCALVISIPSAILAAIAWGARRGILFRGGAALEKLAGVDVVALDKTGTLTTGELVVESVESFPPGREEEVTTFAMALEKEASHPIAHAIVRYGRERGLQPREVEKFRAITGAGVQGEIGAARCVLGRRELLEQGSLAEWAKSLPLPPPEFAEVWLVTENLLGRLLLRDQIRTQSAPVLAALKAEGLHTVMLTGDRRETAEAVGKQIGLSEVRAGLQPADKVAVLRDFKKQGRKVAMVGDGVNDAPCLAAADVAVGMGARGADAALEQSEIVLMGDKIELFLDAYHLSHRTRRIIHQNLIVSLGTILVMVCAALPGLVPITLGVVAHEGSTVIVCLNSLRLLWTGKKDR